MDEVEEASKDSDASSTDAEQLGSGPSIFKRLLQVLRVGIPIVAICSIVLLGFCFWRLLVSHPEAMAIVFAASCLAAGIFGLANAVRMKWAELGVISSVLPGLIYFAHLLSLQEFDKFARNFGLRGSDISSQSALLESIFVYEAGVIGSAIFGMAIVYGAFLLSKKFVSDGVGSHVISAVAMVLAALVPVGSFFALRDMPEKKATEAWIEVTKGEPVLDSSLLGLMRVHIADNPVTYYRAGGEEPTLVLLLSTREEPDKPVVGCYRFVDLRNVQLLAGPPETAQRTIDNNLNCVPR